MSAASLSKAFKELFASFWIVSCFLFASAAFAPHSLAQPPGSGYRPDDWTKIQEAAKGEGKVMLYSVGIPAIHDRLRADFKQANPGLVLEIFRPAGSFALISRVEQERLSKADGADIVIVTDTLWLEKLAEGRFLRAPVGPSAVGWPGQFLSRGVAPFIALEPHAIVYNTNLVKTAITGYKDLVKPEAKLKLGSVNIIAPVVVAFYDWLEKTAGPDFLKNFAAAKPNLYQTHTTATQAVASGEIAATVASNTTTAMAIIAEGAPVKMVVPNPGLAFIYAAGVLTTSKRQNAALILMDYLMSRRGQTMWNGRGTTASPLKNIPGALDVQTITPWDAAKYPPEVVKAYTERWNSIVKGQ